MLTVQFCVYNNYKEIKYAKNLDNVLNQNVTVTKRSRIATFAISIVENLAYFYYRHCNQKKVFYESNIMTILDVFISRGKKLTVVEEVILAAGDAL